MEDEKAQLIDLSDTLREEGVAPTPQPREHVSSTAADEVVISVEEEPAQTAEEPKTEERHSPFAWIRRK